jgi:hypothetical protein
MLERSASIYRVFNIDLFLLKNKINQFKQKDKFKLIG